MDEEPRKERPTLGSTPEQGQSPKLRAQILRSKIKTIKSVDQNFTGEETMSWLVRMDESVFSADETILPGKLLDASQMTMPVLMDLLFDNLERYSFEFNKRKEFTLSCLRPNGYQEKVDHFHRRKVRYMKGHLSSDEFSMIFYAVDSKVEIFIIPTDFLVGFDAEESDFPSFVSLDKLSVQDSSSWGIDRTKISLNEFPRLCRRLIGQLVKVARGEANATDKFTFSTSSSDQVDHVPDRTFEYLEEDDFGLHPGEQLPSQPKASTGGTEKTEAEASSQFARPGNMEKTARPESQNRPTQSDQSGHPFGRDSSEFKRPSDFASKPLSTLARSTVDGANPVREEATGEEAKITPAEEAITQPAESANNPPREEPEPGTIARPTLEFRSAMKEKSIAKNSESKKALMVNNKSPRENLDSSHFFDKVSTPASSTSDSSPQEDLASQEAAVKDSQVMVKKDSIEHFMLGSSSDPEDGAISEARSETETASGAAPGAASGASSGAASEAEAAEQDSLDEDLKTRLQARIEQSQKHTVQMLDISSEFKDVKGQVDAAQETVVDACCVIVTGIDDALESMEEAGVQALKSDNIEAVTQIMHESRRLRAVKDKLVAVAKDISEI